MSCVKCGKRAWYAHARTGQAYCGYACRGTAAAVPIGSAVAQVFAQHPVLLERGKSHISECLNARGDAYLLPHRRVDVVQRYVGRLDQIDVQRIGPKTKGEKRAAGSATDEELEQSKAKRTPEPTRVVDALCHGRQYELPLPDEFWLDMMLEMRTEDIIAMERVNKDLYCIAQAWSVKRRIRLDILSRFDQSTLVYADLSDIPMSLVATRDIPSGTKDTLLHNETIDFPALYDIIGPQLDRWDYDILSRNPAITPAIVEIYSGAPWVWGRSGLSSNKSITPEFIVRNKSNDWQWGRSGLSNNPAVTPEVIERHPNKPWHWGYLGLSNNPSITLEFVTKHIDADWDWPSGGLSRNPVITPEFVEKHPELPWRWYGNGLSRNNSITPSFVERHPLEDWEWGVSGLSSNTSVTHEFIERHLDKPWSWGGYGLSYNKAITPEFVERHLDKPWNWSVDGLSSNETITPQFVLRHIQKPFYFIKVLSRFHGVISRRAKELQELVRSSAIAHSEIQRMTHELDLFIRDTDRLFRAVARQTGKLVDRKPVATDTAAPPSSLTATAASSVATPPTGDSAVYDVGERLRQ